MTSNGLTELPLKKLQARRDAIFDALGEGVLVLPAAPLQFDSRDNERPYRPDSELYYATGATGHGVVGVIGGAEREWTLFVPARDPAAELWSGPAEGPDEVAERLEPDHCHPAAELAERLPSLLDRSDRIYFRLGQGGAVERHVIEALQRARARGARTGSGPRALVDPGELLDDLRLRKDECEIAAIRRAVDLSVEGHRAGARFMAAGVGEWEVEAVVERAYRAHSDSGAAFGTIVGSGANACVLHYRANRDVIGAGDLVLVDAGARRGMYQGDLTRTYPAGGAFSGPQREVYDLVDAARRAAVEAVAPGVPVAKVHDRATQVLVEGLVGLGLLQGNVEELIKEGSHKAYYPHQTSHWLGLDVHDVADYARAGSSRKLEAGMVLTIEPGLYFSSGVAAAVAAAGTGGNGASGTGGAGGGGGKAHRATDSALLERYVGIGVRIEDDVLVTEEGCEVLSRALPTAADEVAALVREGS